MADSSKRPSVFFSYTWDDQDIARQLVAALKTAGYNVWFDFESLKSGQHIWKIIATSLAVCDAYVVLISDHSLKSKGVQTEFDMAFTRSVNDNFLIVPVILGDCDWKKELRLVSKLCVPLSMGFDAAVAQIIKALPPPQPNAPEEGAPGSESGTASAATTARRVSDPTQIGRVLYRHCISSANGLLGNQWRHLGESASLKHVMAALDPTLIEFQLARFGASFANVAAGAVAEAGLDATRVDPEQLKSVAQQVAATLGQPVAQYRTARAALADLDLPDSPEGKVLRALTESVVKGNPLFGASLGAVIGTALLPGVGTAIGGLIGGAISRFRAHRTDDKFVRQFREAYTTMIRACQVGAGILYDHLREQLQATMNVTVPTASDIQKLV